MQMIKFIYIFIAGVNILTLSYAEKNEISPPRFIKRSDEPVQHIPIFQMPKTNLSSAVATHDDREKESALLVNTNGVAKNLDESQPKNKEADVVNAKITSVETLSKSNATVEGNETVVQNIAGKRPDEDTGALKRGSLVFLGLCVIILGYYAWRSYRLRKPSSSPVIVQKYGIRTNRSDIEMRPLPLDEEDDDDTLFEIGNGINNRQ